MDQGLATVLAALIAAFAAITSAKLVTQATIAAARLAHGKEVQDQEPSKLTKLLRVSPGFVAPVIFYVGIVSVFIYIPFVSDYAFWLVVLAYGLMAYVYRPSSK
jgi:hypothetical protein